MTTNDLLNTYTELFVMYDSDDNQVPPHFECSNCDRDVTDEPCPSHAPLTDLPGLRLIDCDAAPRHYTWAHQRDDYGLPCPWCQLADHAERDRLARQCRHWGWRKWQVTRWLAGQAYALGVIGGYGTTSGDGHDWCVTYGRFRGSRPYVLGAAKTTWRCWSRGHRRGEEVGFGFCGKCVPWPCCGSEHEAHAAGCTEAVSR